MNTLYRLARLISRLPQIVSWHLHDAFPPGHFHSLLPDKSDLLASLTNNTSLLADLDLREAAQCEMFSAIAPTCTEFLSKLQAAPVRHYSFPNGYFPKGDAIILHGMLRHFRPARIIEAGSGYSSAAMLDTVNWFFPGQTSFTFIEPNPQRLRTVLQGTDIDSVILEQKIQQTPLELFAALQANDWLFIDSSHVAKANSDLLHIVFSILPVLRPGVIIHFHDIFWPFEYPADYFNAGMVWNESYFLRCFLQDNRRYEILLFNSMLFNRFYSLLIEQVPDLVEGAGSGLWIRKVG